MKYGVCRPKRSFRPGRAVVSVALIIWVARLWAYLVEQFEASFDCFFVCHYVDDRKSCAEEHESSLGDRHFCYI